MPLTGKQKSELRGIAQAMSDDIQLGKAGLSETFVQHAGELLRRKELIKLRFTDLEGAARHDLAAEVAGALDAELVGVIGKTMLLYKANPELDRAKRALK